MGLKDRFTKRNNEYSISGNEVEKLGVEFSFPDEAVLGEDGVFVMRLRQDKKERRRFEEAADALHEFDPSLPRYTFRCAKCARLYLQSDLRNFHILTPSEISTVCRYCL